MNFATFNQSNRALQQCCHKLRLIKVHVSPNSFIYWSTFMTKSLIAKALIAVSLISALTVLAPSLAMARVASTLPHGVKCVTVGTLNPDGTVTYSAFCWKGA
jgi:hypothetical protein